MTKDDCAHAANIAADMLFLDFLTLKDMKQRALELYNLFGSEPKQAWDEKKYVAGQKRARVRAKEYVERLSEAVMDEAETQSLRSLALKVRDRVVEALSHGEPLSWELGLLVDNILGGRVMRQLRADGVDV